jgi:chromate transporter
MDARLAEMAREFTRLGLTAFGGPAAHLAIMQRELVERRGWLSQERFVDLIGLSSLLPGPSSTEVALGIGFERARWRGLAIAALGFIGPAALIMLILAALYVEVGMLGGARSLLYGMTPVVVAVIAHAMLKLAPAAFTDLPTWLVGTAALALSFLILQPLLILAGGAVVILAVRRGPGWLSRSGALPGMLVSPLGGGSASFATVAAATAGTSGALGLAALFLTFLKLGLVVFGSGYVLITFLGAELVAPGYISEQELLDAVALGQLTPGPVFTTATFIGYLLAGVPGAVVATVGIFLPAVVLVGVAHPWLGRMRASATLSAAIEGVNAAAIGLIGYSVVVLGLEAIAPDGTVDSLAGILAAGSFVLLVSGRVGPVPLLLGGALVGFVVRSLPI